jgi:hypothetical protein
MTLKTIQISCPSKPDTNSRLFRVIQDEIFSCQPKNQKKQDPIAENRAKLNKTPQVFKPV